MILTDEEMKQIQLSLEERSGLDEECSSDAEI